MLTAPQQCSTFLTKHERVLTDSNSSCAQYLFQKDKFYDTTYDTGDKHIQCGRRADVFKFWFMWKAKVCPSTSEKRSVCCTGRLADIRTSRLRTTSRRANLRGTSRARRIIFTSRFTKHGIRPRFIACAPCTFSCGGQD